MKNLQSGSILSTIVNQSIFDSSRKVRLSFLAATVFFSVLPYSVKSQTTLFQSALQIATSDNATQLTGAIGQLANAAAAGHTSRDWDFFISGDRRYGTDISSVLGGFSYNSEKYSVGSYFGRYGIDEFHSTIFSAHFTRALSVSTSLAIQGHYSQLNISGSNSSSEGDMSLGLWHEFSDHLITSISVRNLMNGIADRIMEEGKIDISLAYILSEKAQLFGGVSHTWTGKISFRPGVMYAPDRYLNLFISLNTSPSATSFGMSLSILEELQLDLGIHTHPVLGNSLSITLGYSP